jgi:hypothetical protein
MMSNAAHAVAAAHTAVKTAARTVADVVNDGLDIGGAGLGPTKGQ